MGKGRAPCCDKTKVKRGQWSREEDLKLISFIQKFGHENWRSLPKKSGLLRCGKSCRLRWINYLRPDVRRGNFTAGEEETIIKLHQNYGNKWAKIASQLPGRTDNEIKNVWHTNLKKRLARSSATSPSSSDFNSCGKEDKSKAEDSLNMKTSQDFTTSVSSTSNHEDDPSIGPLFNDIIQEVDKKDLLEILLDSDPDIWSFLDGSKSIQQSGGNEFRAEEESDEDEVKKWFKNLESELGLEEGVKQQHNKHGSQDEEESSLLKTYEFMIH